MLSQDKIIKIFPTDMIISSINLYSDCWNHYLVTKSAGNRNKVLWACLDVLNLKCTSIVDCMVTALKTNPLGLVIHVGMKDTLDRLVIPSVCDIWTNNILIR